MKREREKLLPSASQIVRVLDLKLPNGDCCFDLLSQSHVGHPYKKGYNWRSHHRTVNFAHITEADIGLAKYREMNVVRFSVTACGKEHCVTTQIKKRLCRRPTQNASWRLFGPLVLLEFCSERNCYNLRICCRGVFGPC